MLLKGLNVVEWATWVAGPGAGAVMADWGAQVTKVESGTGDATRAFFHDALTGSPVFANENRGKRGVVLDVAKPEGRAALIALLKDADIFITNVRPGSLRRARLDYDSLKAELPRLIYANVTGYGLVGEDIDVPAFDFTGFWTRSGVAASTIPPDQDPYTCRPGFGDHTTALATLSGVLAAVHERHATGKGRHVETSLLRAGVYALSWDYSIQLRYGDATTAQARHDRPEPLMGFFRSGDDRWFCVATRGPRDLPAVLRVIGREDLTCEPRCTPPVRDLDVVRMLRAVLDAAFGAMTLEAILAMLKGADVIAAAMATMEEVIADPQAHDAGCFVETPDGRGSSFLAPATPVRFPGLETGPAGPAPRLGEHTRQVLREAGYAEAAIETLIASGAAS